MYKVYMETRRDNLRNEIDRARALRSDLGVMASEQYMNIMTFANNLSQVVTLAEELRNLHPGTRTAKSALLHLASLGGYSGSYKRIAAHALNVLKREFPGQVDEGLLTSLEWLGEESMEKPTSSSKDQGFSLASYPNPFNPTTTIKFDLPVPSHVSLVVYDVLGRKVAVLENGMKEAGYHSATWNASKIAIGMYFARLTATDANGILKLSKMMKLVLVK
jgi:hypothetical protein